MLIKTYILKDNILVEFTGKKCGGVKKFLSKEQFDQLFFTQKLTRLDMALLGIGSKLFVNSYHYHYPLRAERAKIAGSKISLSQKNINSNSVNAGLPRKLFKKEELERLLNEGRTLYEICNHFNCSEPTINANIDYYQLLDFTTRKIKGNRLLALRRLEKLTGKNFVSLFSQGSSHIDFDKLRSYILEAESEMQLCKDVIQQIRQGYSIGAGIGSRYERAVKHVLDDEGILYIPQYAYKKHRFDFFLPESKILIEVDGEGHNTKSDSIKESFANELGFKLIRLDIKLKNKKSCLEEIRLKLLEKLVLS